MSLKYKLIAAAASAVLAVSAMAQGLSVNAAAKVDTPVAEPEAGVAAGTQVEAGAQAAVSGEAQAAPATTAGAASGEAGGEAQAQAGAAAAVVAPATAADLRVGATVQDPQGGAVGTIESVDAEGAVVSTGSARAKLPVSSFGKNANALVISMTRAELEAAVSARTGS